MTGHVVVLKTRQNVLLGIRGIQGPPGAGGGGASGASGASAFAFGDATPEVVYTAPSSSPVTVTVATVVIDTPFNGTGAALTLGTSGTPAAVMDTPDIDCTQVGSYAAYPDLALAAGQTLLLYITPGAGASQGSGKVVIEAWEVAP